MGDKQRKKKLKAAPIGRSFWGTALLPIVFIFSTIVIDIALYAFLDTPFPQYYFVSFLLVLALAGVVSCIPNRTAQVTIYSVFIVMQVLLSIFNLIAMVNLGEIFHLEILRSLKEVFLGGGAAKVSGIVEMIIVFLFGMAFIATAVVISKKTKHRKAGYSLRGLVVMICVAVFTFTTFTASPTIIKSDKNSDSALNKLTDAVYSLNNFTNRPLVFNSFGLQTYYINNLLAIMGVKSMANSSDTDDIELDWNGRDYYDEYPYMLDGADENGDKYNVIVLLMESVEYDGINPYITPNLWGIRQMSTWVDGFYSTERTCYNEYLALCGTAVSGVEMWRDYYDVEVPQSLPNIFKRAGYDQTAAFHNYYKDFYRRDRLFDKLGFDFYNDITDYRDGAPNPIFNNNSDIEMFTLMKEDIAPTDGRSFFSYVMNLSTHAPNYNSNITKVHTQSYAEILTAIEQNSLEQVYPKLMQGNVTEKNAVISYLTGLREYDKGIGILLQHLRDNNLMDNTALVLFSDHYNNMAYGQPAASLAGGLLTDEFTNKPNGEKISFMIYNPRDTDAVENGGRRVEGFMANNDIYKTICHLFNIETHDNFTPGNSILTRISEFYPNFQPTVSVGIGFNNAKFLSQDFWTRDFKKIHGISPSDEILQDTYIRAEEMAKTMLKSRSLYDGNALKKDYRTEYVMTVRK